MKTSDEIILKEAGFTERVLIDQYRNKPTISISEAANMINEARKDLLEELANETCIAPYGVEPYISREEILDKIKELK